MTNSDKCPLCGSEKKSYLGEGGTSVVYFACGYTPAHTDSTCPKAHEVAIELKEKIEGYIDEIEELRATKFDLEEEVERLKEMIRKDHRGIIGCSCGICTTRTNPTKEPRQMTNSDKCPDKCICGNGDYQDDCNVRWFGCGAAIHDEGEGEIEDPCPKAHEKAIELKERLGVMNKQVVRWEKLYNQQKEEIERLKGLLVKVMHIAWSNSSTASGRALPEFQRIIEIIEKESPEPVETNTCNWHRGISGYDKGYYENCPECNLQTTKEGK